MAFWHALTKSLNIKLKLSMAYHPQSNGQTKQINQILEQYLCNYCLYQQDNWVNYLPIAKFAYNNASHSASRQSPFFANYAYHPPFSPVLSRQDSNPAAMELSDRLAIIRKELWLELQLAQESSKRKYNALHSQPPPLKVGDQVMLCCCNIKTTRPSNKLNYWKLGPFSITRAIGDYAFELALPPSLLRLHPVFNINLLKPYTPLSIIPGQLLSLVPAAVNLEEGDGPDVLKIKEILNV